MGFLQVLMEYENVTNSQQNVLHIKSQFRDAKKKKMGLTDI